MILRLGDTLYRRPNLGNAKQMFIWAVQADGLEVRSYHNIPVKIEVIPWRELSKWKLIAKNPTGARIDISEVQLAKRG